LVPDLPLRLHPGVARLQEAIATGELGAFRGIRHECPANPADGELARTTFPRMVDVVRALLGEIEALTASGDPPGQYVQVNAALPHETILSYPGLPLPATLTGQAIVRVN
jgi:predicted dehydrogenase